jgi:ketosteroid isomerase-like protein
VACDIEAYLSIWAEECTVEGPTHLIEGRTNLRKAIEAAWHLQNPVHMSTRSIAVNGDVMFHEFVLVWEHRESPERSLHTGSTVSGVDSSGQWSWLREYFDPSDRRRASAATLRNVRDLLP